MILRNHACWEDGFLPLLPHIRSSLVLHFHLLLSIKLDYDGPFPLALCHLSIFPSGQRCGSDPHGLVLAIW
jgi:hypothetical protein